MKGDIAKIVFGVEIGTVFDKPANNVNRATKTGVVEGCVEVCGRAIDGGTLVEKDVEDTKEGSARRGRGAVVADEIMHWGETRGSDDVWVCTEGYEEHDGVELEPPCGVMQRRPATIVASINVWWFLCSHEMSDEIKIATRCGRV